MNDITAIIITQLIFILFGEIHQLSNKIIYLPTTIYIILIILTLIFSIIITMIKINKLKNEKRTK